MNTICKFAVASALLAAAATASALDTTHYAGAVKLYYGGATATDNVLENIWEAKVKGICRTDAPVGQNAIDVYRAANERVVVCNVTSAQVAGFPAGGANGAGGQDVAFHKESQGGSANGPLPLIALAKGQANTLQWLDLAQLTAADLTTCGSTAVAATTSLNGFQDHPACPAKLTALSVNPNAGIADVEPTLLAPPPSATDVSSFLSVKSGLQIVFGVPVTTKLYRALQQAQGIIADKNGLGGIAACNAANDSSACVPSLTRNQIRSLYTQTFTSWANFTDKNGATLTTSPLISAANLPTTPDVYICRRVDSSGTEASFESFWLRQRCEPGVPAMALPDDNSTTNDTVWAPPTAATLAAGSLVNAGPSSGNVRSCLQFFNNNSRCATGIISTEVTASNLSGAGDGFRFVAVDNVAPTIANTINGDYEFFTENTLQKVKDGKTGAIPVGDLRRTLIDYIEANLGLPAVIADLNGSYAGRPWGNGGVLALPGSGVAAAAPVSAAAAVTTPIGKASHSTTGTTSNCAPAVMTDVSPADTVQSY
jgi:hypothetical protein